jgi:clathrin heavy chain
MYIFSKSRLLQVVGNLLDVNYDETTVKGSLASVTGNFPIDELVREVEQRTRLKLILLWLEPHHSRVAARAMAEIYINSNPTLRSLNIDSGA